jgi:hypothetical protein
MGVNRDLRGIAASVHNRRTYCWLFDVSHPYHISLMSKVVDLWHHQPNVTFSVMRFLCERYHAIIITRRIESISIRAVQMVFCFSESLVMLFVLMEDDCWRIQCKPARSLTCTRLVKGNEQSAATVFALEYSPYIIMTQLWRILSKWHYKWP